MEDVRHIQGPITAFYRNRMVWLLRVRAPNLAMGESLYRYDLRHTKPEWSKRESSLPDTYDVPASELLPMEQVIEYEENPKVVRLPV